MPKKLIRIQQPQALDLKKYLNRDLDIVLKSGAVFFGQVKEIRVDKLFFSDKIRNKHVFEITELQEIIIDEIHHF